MKKLLSLLLALLVCVPSFALAEQSEQPDFIPLLPELEESYELLHASPFGMDNGEPLYWIALFQSPDWLALGMFSKGAEGIELEAFNAEFFPKKRVQAEQSLVDALYVHSYVPQLGLVGTEGEEYYFEFQKIFGSWLVAHGYLRKQGEDFPFYLQDGKYLRFGTFSPFLILAGEQMLLEKFSFANIEAQMRFFRNMEKSYFEMGFRPWGN